MYVHVLLAQITRPETRFKLILVITEVRSSNPPSVEPGWFVRQLLSSFPFSDDNETENLSVDRFSRSTRSFGLGLDEGNS